MHGNIFPEVEESPIIERQNDLLINLIIIISI
jgi:hypothetical protein